MEWHIPNLPLKIIFFLNVLLTCSGSLWVNIEMYILSNSLYLLLILPVLYLRESEEAPFMGFCMAIISLAMDLFVTISYYGLHVQTWLAVANEIVKCVGIVVMVKIFRERSATYGNIVLPSGLDNLLAGSVGRGPYEDIDGLVQSESTDLVQGQNKDLGSPDTFLNP